MAFLLLVHENETLKEDRKRSLRIQKALLTVYMNAIKYQKMMSVVADIRILDFDTEEKYDFRKKQLWNIRQTVAPSVDCFSVGLI